MAENEEGRKENKRFFGGLRDKLYNFIQPAMKPLGFRKKTEEGYGVDQQSFFHQLNKEVSFSSLGARNQDLLRVEKAMDNLGKFKENIVHLQKKIGPYTTWSSVERERHLVREGFFEGEKFDDPSLLIKGLQLDIPSGPATKRNNDVPLIASRNVSIPLPKRRTVILEQFFLPPYRKATDSMSYHYVSYFGEHRNKEWKSRFKEVLKEVFERKDGEGKKLADRYKEYIEVDESIGSEEKAERQNEVEESLKKMKEYYEVLIDKALDHILEMEQKVREDFDRVWQAHKNLDDVRKESFTDALDHVKNLFVTPPTYNVAYPYKVEGNERIVPTGISLNKGWPEDHANLTNKKGHHLPALHTSIFMYAQLDALRDDIRDGRKRKSSFSVMEYLMSQHDVQGLGKVRLGERDWAMMNSGGNSLSNKKQPTQFNPAFDLRAKNNSFTHRKGTYFDVGSNSALVDDPLVSTRGGAMYIVDRVMMNMANWEEARSMLRGIGDQIKGFDIGARPWGMFGERLPLDPFAVDEASFNTPPVQKAQENSNK